jgi:hypothetical protein
MAAWTNATRHVVSWSGAEDDETEPPEYYTIAERDLPLWLSMAQTGVEHLIKARIVDISPYLLLTNASEKLGAAKRDLDFSEFKTLDAQDLLKVMRGATNVDPSSDFSRAYDERRRERNEQYHTVPRGIARKVREVVHYVLQSTHELVGDGAWIRMRWEHLESEWRTPYYAQGLSSTMNAELRMIVELLDPSDSLKYLGLNTRKRLYSCPNCLGDCEETEYDVGRLQMGVAQLTTKERGTPSIYCVVCGYIFEVTRERCSQPECEGDVLHHGTCLTCHSTSDDETKPTWSLDSAFNVDCTVEGNHEGETGWFVLSWYLYNGQPKTCWRAEPAGSESEARAMHEKMMDELRASEDRLLLQNFEGALRPESAVHAECKTLCDRLGCELLVYQLNGQLVRARTTDCNPSQLQHVKLWDIPKFVKLVQIDGPDVRTVLNRARDWLRMLAGEQSIDVMEF